MNQSLPDAEFLQKMVPLLPYCTYPHSYTCDQDGDQRSAFGYQQTLMYGRYSKALGEQLKEEAKRIRQLEKQRKEEYRRQRKELR